MNPIEELWKSKGFDLRLQSPSKFVIPKFRAMVTNATMKTFGYILAIVFTVAGVGHVLYGLHQKRERWHLRFCPPGSTKATSEWHTQGPFEINQSNVYTFRTVDGFDLGVDANKGTVTVERER